MFTKDKIKFLVIFVLILLMGITYYFVGKESIIMKYASGGSLLVWLATLFILNKKFK